MPLSLRLLNKTFYVVPYTRYISGHLISSNRASARRKVSYVCVETVKNARAGVVTGGRDSTVDITSCCGLDGPGFEPVGGEIFRTCGPGAYPSLRTFFFFFNSSV